MAEAFITRRGSTSATVIIDTLPAQVGTFVAFPDYTPQVTLTWTNPSSYWSGTVIVKKLGSYPTGLLDGERIYDGTDATFVDTNVGYDTTYYYRIFPYNAKKQFQTQYKVASATPKNAILLSSLALMTRLKIYEYSKLVPFYVAKHDYESGNNGAGRTLLVRQKSYNSRAFDTSSSSATNVYNPSKSTNIAYWLHSTYGANVNFGRLGSLKSTIIPTTRTTGSTSAGLATTVNVRAFLLSLYEYGITKPNTRSEGSTLSCASKLWGCYNESGRKMSHWTRTPLYSTSNKVWYMRDVLLSNGTPNIGTTTITGTNYVRPCVCGYGDFLINPTPDADGCYTLFEED